MGSDFGEICDIFIFHGALHQEASEREKAEWRFREANSAVASVSFRRMRYHGCKP